ncbi:Ragulator complex protein LAMTOR3-B [Halotydeus destructor]|nr:Ragulator complex protein LAMTOR3-B [Halotydeus destructor]
MTAAEELQRELHLIMENVSGLQVIVITDRDGVPLIKASKELAPELALRPTFLATGSITNDQGGKLGIGKCRGVYCEYENQQVMNFNKHPFTVTLIATSKANTGMLLTLQNSFDAILSELHKVVENV